MRESTQIKLHFLFGTMDFLTGLMLLAFPDWTQSLLHLNVPLESEQALLQLIGAFVLATGSAYALPFVLKGRLAVACSHVWILTCLDRFLIALVVSLLIVTDRLSISWCLVALTDASIALIQITWLKGVNRGS